MSLNRVAYIHDFVNYENMEERKIKIGMQILMAIASSGGDILTIEIAKQTGISREDILNNAKFLILRNLVKKTRRWNEHEQYHSLKNRHYLTWDIIPKQAERVERLLRVAYVDLYGETNDY